MKEDEAKQKWCPYARSRSIQRGDGVTVCGALTTVCIASDCMAWRWDEFINITPEADVIREGYCGLAGKP